MVCESCIKKLGKLITPDKWKTGSRNTVGNTLKILYFNWFKN